MRKTSLKRAQWADGNLEYNIDDRNSIPDTTSDLVIAGRDQDGIVALGAVEIAEIILFDNSLSDENLLKMQGYLAHKWGLHENLPISHPYRNEIPKFENRPEILLENSYSIKVGEYFELPV